MPYKDPAVAKAKAKERHRAYYLRNREAVLAKNAAWYKANPERAREMTRRWRELNPTYYSDNREEILAAVKSHNEANKEARSAYNRVYRETNRTALAEKRRAYVEEHRDEMREQNARRRALLRDAPRVEKIDRGAIYERDGGVCHFCGTVVSRQTYALDHLVPLSRGGAHITTNLRVAHKACNSRSGAGRLPAQLLLV